MLLRCAVALATAAAAGGGGGDPTTTTTRPVLDVSLTDLAVATGETAFFAIPLAVTLWALVDAARRPRWAWALADRRQVVWMAVILFGVLTVVGGLAISAYYLAKIRGELARAEAGDF